MWLPSNQTKVCIKRVKQWLLLVRLLPWRARFPWPAFQRFTHLWRGQCWVWCQLEVGESRGFWGCAQANGGLNVTSDWTSEVSLGFWQRRGSTQWSSDQSAPFTLSPCCSFGQTSAHTLIDTSLSSIGIPTFHQSKRVTPCPNPDC